MTIKSTSIFTLSTFCFVFCMMITQSYGQEWEKMNNTIFTRNHGIGFAIDGYGYILTGGSSETDETNFHSRDFHRYDPVTDTWEKLDYDGTSRGYGIGAVWDGLLYFGFGLDNNFGLLNDLWSWDPTTNTFTELPSCPCEGRTHPAFVTMDNKVYVGMGGGSGGNLGDWWQYDIETQVWTQKAGMPGNRHHPYMFVIEDDIYVGSGHRTTWFKYDVETDSWTQIADLDDRVAGTQFSYGGRGYALSGTDNFHDNLATGEFWQYIPEIDSWIELEPHPGQSRWAPSSFIIDGYVYIVSGWTANPSVEEYEVYRYLLAESPTGTEEEWSDFQQSPFDIYPNPATEFINIDYNIDPSKVSSLQIFDASSKMVFEKKEAVQQIELDQFVSGSYWIYMTVGDKRIRKQFVKQ